MNNAGTFTHSFNDTLTSSSSADPAFTNSGTFRKSAGGGTTFFYAVLSNGGNIDIGSGVVSFDTAIPHFTTGASITGVGVMETAGHWYVDGATSLGPSTTIRNSSELYGAGTLSVSGTLDWRSGAMRGSGTTRVLTGGKLDLAPLSAGIDLVDSRVVQVDVGGALDWDSGGFSFGGSATLTNAGTFTTTFDATITSTGTADPAFTNSGTFNKTGGTGTTFIYVPFSNSGIFDIDSGKVNFLSGLPPHFTAGSSITGAGIIEVENIYVDGATIPERGQHAAALG